MQPILAVTRAMDAVLAPILALGRGIAVACMGLMVLCILIQVFFRYVLNNALPWPDEAARFLMLWMTGVVAPTAYRRGGFVAIDMVRLAFPRIVASLLWLFLLVIALMVLWVGTRLALAEVTGFGGRFATAALYIPFQPLGICDGSLGLKAAGDGAWCRVPRSWMMASMFVCGVLMFAITVELILREIVVMLGGGDHLPEIPESATVGAE